MNKKKKCSGLPFRYLWTWDHSTNWDLNAHGQLDWGCNNVYLKSKETYLLDYKKLIDYASSLNITGIVIWGFLRDVHGGVEYGKEISKYARSKDISIFPGIGTSYYGGFYYEGNHSYNVSNWLKKHPHLAMVNKEGNKAEALCPTHPDNIKWLKEGVEWLFETFKLDGANLENGDGLVCYCNRCQKIRSELKTDDPDYFLDQYSSYLPILECLNKKRYRWVTYATYSGFPSSTLRSPFFAETFPENAICQWTLTRMIREVPLSLAAYLKNGVPSEVYENPRWPKGTFPPTKRNAGLVHQGSQCYYRDNKGFTRYSLEIASIKEACLRAYQAGFVGISIQGEVSAYSPVWDLNYRAFSYFADKPEASLYDFASEGLSKWVGGSDLTIFFMNLLARHELGKLTRKDFNRLLGVVYDFQKEVYKGDKYGEFRRWAWLLNYISKGNEELIIIDWKKHGWYMPHFKDAFLLMP